MPDGSFGRAEGPLLALGVFDVSCLGSGKMEGERERVGEERRYEKDKLCDRGREWGRATNREIKTT